jgi:hypothetical protein
MENMDLFYSGYFQGIAVHNGDVMTDIGHDTPFSALISGYPNALVDRGPEVDPSSMENDFLTSIQAAPKAFMKNGATYNAVTRELKVSIQSVFQSAASGSYKIACVITEDSIKGTASTYNQTNYYSSTSQNLPLVGAGRNWQTESAAVSYTKMQYDYVSRLISPSFYGTNQCFTSTMAVNDTFTHTFTFILPAAWKDNYLHIVGILINPAGKIDNGSSTTIAEAVANGYQTGCEVTTALASLTTTAATTITTTTAKSGGTLTSSGGTPILAKGVCWNTAGMPTFADAKTSNGIGTTGYTSSLTSLTNNTLYYVRAYAINSKDTAYGTQKTFTTLSLVGINEISNSENVIVVSPVVDAILLYGIKDEIKSIQLIDINGRVMTTYANLTVNDGTLSLPLDNSLSNGMYFLRINNHAYKIMKVTK